MSGVAALLLAASLGAPLALEAKGIHSLVPALVQAIEGAGRQVTDGAPVLVTLTPETPARVRVEARLGNRRAEAFVELGHSQPFERARTLALHCLALVQEVEKAPVRRRAHFRPRAGMESPAPDPPHVDSPLVRQPLVFAQVIGRSSTLAPALDDRPNTPSTDVPLHVLSVEPVLLEPVAPERIREHYPLRARLEGVTSTVVLELHLDETGAVTGSRVLEEHRPGFGFATAARTIARRLRFSPAMLGRKAVPTRLVLTIRFELP